MPKAADTATDHGGWFQTEPPGAPAGTTKAKCPFLHFEPYRVKSKGIAQMHVKPFAFQIDLQASDRLVNTRDLFDGKLTHVDGCRSRFRPTIGRLGWHGAVPSESELENSGEPF